MLPAFGRELLDLRLAGKRPAQPVYVVGHWDLARELRLRERFALMAEGEPDNYGFLRFRKFDFSMVKDLDVVVVPDTLEFLGSISPQVQFARPRSLQRTPIFHWGLDTAADFVAGAMARVEAELQAA